MAQAERQAIQSDLAWVGSTTAPSAAVGERRCRRDQGVQKERGGKPTGVLNPQERSALAETASGAAG